ADEWRKLVKQRDRAWDNAQDEKARKAQQRIDELEKDLSPEAEAYLNGEGWPAHSDPDAWRELARNLQDIEAGRGDAVEVAASAVRHIPKTNEWDRMTSVEKESVITVLTAMNKEVAEGRDPQAFLEDVFRRRYELYGGGADAREATEGLRDQLAEFMRGGIQ